MPSLFWNTRRRTLVAGVSGLALVFLVALAGAQKPENKNVVTIPNPSLEVHLSLLPGKQETELEFRVQINPQIKTPPAVEYQDMAGGPSQTVKIEPDAKGEAWVGTITQGGPFGVGYIHVMTTSDSGLVERHELRFATRGTVKDQPTVVNSVDGRFALVALAGNVPADARFLVTTFTSPNPPLPAGLKLEAGPFEVKTTQQMPTQLKASVAIQLAEPSPNNNPPQYQLRRLDPAKGVWEVLPADIDSNSPAAQANITSLGVFVLTSEAK